MRQCSNQLTGMPVVVDLVDPLENGIPVRRLLAFGNIVFNLLEQRSGCPPRRILAQIHPAFVLEQFCFVRRADPWLTKERREEDGAGDGVDEVEVEFDLLRWVLDATSKVGCASVV